MVSVWNVG